MGRFPKSSKVVLATCVLAAAMAVGASAATVEVGDLVLHADGGFSPNTLPRRKFVPIEFHGHAEIEARHGGLPPALSQAVIDFDRDGRLSTDGLALCAPEQVQDASPQQARQLCPNAIVGTGHLAGLIALPGLPPLPANSLLTIFNGPRQEGNPTVILHAQMAGQTLAVVVPIERQPGAYGYRATIDVPEIAAGYGVLTHIDAMVGKRYVFAGKQRSYTSARCTDGILQTRGRFTFTDGTIVDGSVFKPCNTP